jgi:LysM repeat protein
MNRLTTLLLSILLVGVVMLTPAIAHAEDGVHIVRRGESLGMIAQQHGVSVRELIRYNHLSNPNILVAGQRILIPGEYDGSLDESVESASTETISSETASTEENEAAISAVEKVDSAVVTLKPTTVDALPGDNGYHYVRAGQSMTQIARMYGMELEDIMRLNAVVNPDLLHVGQKLRVSVRAPALEADEERDLREARAIHIVHAGETLKDIALEYGATTQDLLAANGLPNEHFLYPGQRLRVHSTLRAAQDMTKTMVKAPPDGKRWIEVNLSDQTLTAWQGDVALMYTSVSTGKASTPTVTGRFHIGTKYTAQRMIGPGYNLPNVPAVMYFYQGYAIHGAYWNPPFGTPSSHGCVNVRPSEAEQLFKWAPAGTEVWVHY